MPQLQEGPWSPISPGWAAKFVKRGRGKKPQKGRGYGLTNPGDHRILATILIARRREGLPFGRFSAMYRVARPASPPPCCAPLRVLGGSLELEKRKGLFLAARMRAPGTALSTRGRVVVSNRRAVAPGMAARSAQRLGKTLRRRGPGRAGFAPGRPRLDHSKSAAALYLWLMSRARIWPPAGATSRPPTMHANASARTWVESNPCRPEPTPGLLTNGPGSQTPRVGPGDRSDAAGAPPDSLRRATGRPADSLPRARGQGRQWARCAAPFSAYQGWF